MDRRLLFPAVAITAWAQQTNPAAVKAEKALRARAQQFYQLQQDKKYRQVEPFVAQDTRDLYYNAQKPEIGAFTIEKVELTDRNTRARVTVKTKQSVMVMGAGVIPFELSSTSLWKVEKGQWVYYVDKDSLGATPFGKLKAGPSTGAEGPGRKGEAPELSTLDKSILMDVTHVELSAEHPKQTVTLTNGLIGPMSVEVDPTAPKVKGIRVEIEKPSLSGGEKTGITLTWDGTAEVNGKVEITTSPFPKTFEIEVIAK